MEGRWTLAGGYAGARHEMFVHAGPQLPPHTKVPVVPCDDAAVERAARALYKDEREDYDPERDALPVRFRVQAQIVLRAAGETP